MAGNFVIIDRDANNKQLSLRVVDATGALVATYGSIKLVLGADPGGTPASPGTNMGKTVMFRETKGCDDTGTPMYCMMLRSEWYATPLTSDPTV